MLWIEHALRLSRFEMFHKDSILKEGDKRKRIKGKGISGKGIESRMARIWDKIG